MLYVFSGSDVEGSRAKAHTLINILRKRQPDAAYIRVLADEFDEAYFDELIGSQGLFASRSLVFCDRPSDVAEVYDYVRKRAADMQTSENVFVVLEGVLTKKQTDAWKNAEKHVVSDRKQEPHKKEVNVFALTDAIGRRDKKTSWLLLHEALVSGKVPQEIHGAVAWFVRSMSAARQSASATEADLKPFVYTKSKKAASNFSEKELRELTRWIATMVETEREGGADLEIELERMVLSL